MVHVLTCYSSRAQCDKYTLEKKDLLQLSTSHRLCTEISKKLTIQEYRTEMVKTTRNSNVKAYILILPKIVTRITRLDSLNGSWICKYS